MRDEKRSDGEMADLYSLVSELDQKKINVVTSVITFAEIHQEMSDEQLSRFRQQFDKPNVSSLDVTQRIAQKAAELRRAFNHPRICFRDAIHLATAMVYKVNAFHTFDAEDTKDCKGLIGLSGDSAVGGLTISKPHTVQTALDLQPH